MAFGKAEESAGFTKVKSTGIHDVTLVRVGSNTRANKSKALSVTVNGGGEYDDLFYDFMDTNYAASWIKADGKPGAVQGRIINPLAIIVGTEDDTIEAQEVQVKDGTAMVDTFIGLSGTKTKIKIAVQMQYNDYYKEMKPTIVAVFNEEGLSATEISKGITEPKQIKLYENLADKGGSGAGASTGGSTAGGGETEEEKAKREADEAF